MPSSTTRPSNWWKTGRVRRVEVVGAEHLARAQDVDGRLAVEQRADLDRRGVGAQDQPGAGRLDEEGVLLLTGGVVGGEVEGVEVQPLRLDLRPLGDLPAHRHEDVLDPLGDQADRVPRPQRSARDAHRDVDGLLDEDALGRARPRARPAGRRAPGDTWPRAWPTRLPASAFALGGRAPISRLASASGALLALVREPGGLELVERRRPRRSRARLGHGLLDRGRVEGGDLDGVVLLVGS